MNAIKTGLSILLFLPGVLCGFFFACMKAGIDTGIELHDEVAR